MKKNAIILTALSLIITACSEQVDDQQIDKSIRFDVSTPRDTVSISDFESHTRGIMVDNNITGKDIAVTAVNASTKADYFSDYIAYSSSEWSSNTTHYWPPAALNFYAHYPYESSPAQITGETTESDGTHHFTYTTPDAAAGQYDLLYATTAGVSSGQVSLAMRHALARISFKAQHASGYDVEIHSIILGNIRKTGRFVYPASSTTTATDGTSPEGTWPTADLSNRGSVTATLKANPINDLTTTLVDVLKAMDANKVDGTLLVIPQTVTSWDPSTESIVSGVAGKTQTSGAYIAVSCKIHNSTTYYVGTSAAPATIYMPIPTGTWTSGEYLTYNLNLGSGYDESGTKIFRAMSNVTIDNINAVTYDGNPKEPTLTVKDGGVTLTEGTHYTVTYSNNTNAGTATATVTGTGIYANTSITKDFIISQATAEKTDPTKKTGLIYTGSDQALANAGTSAYGTYTYCDTENGTYTSTIPTGKDAGNNYTVYWKFTGNGGNYPDDSGSLTGISIAKATPTKTDPTKKTGLIYNGSDQALADAGSSDHGSFTYCDTENGNYSSTIPTGKNAGNAYTVYWKFTGKDGNYTDYAGSLTDISIAKADPTKTDPTKKTGLTYTGSDQALANAGSSDHGSFTYCSTQNGNYTTSIPTGKNASTTYAVYWKFTGDSNHNDASGSLTGISIAKAAGTISNLTFTTPIRIGATCTASVTKTGDGSITYSSGTTSVATVSGTTITGRGRGTSVITATVTDGTNYTYSTKTLTKTLTVNGLSSDDVGKILGANGNVYSTKTAATNAGTTASGLIAYVGSTGSVEAGTSYYALIISLTDGTYSGKTWGPSAECLGYTAQEVARGLKNGLTCTNVLVNSNGSGGTGNCKNHDHQIAKAARNYGTARPSGASAWFLPSLGQVELIVQGLASKKYGSAITREIGTSYSYYASSYLNSVITGAGGTGLQSLDYWTSTEREGPVYSLTLSDGHVSALAKSRDSFPFRAVFAY